MTYQRKEVNIPQFPKKLFRYIFLGLLLFIVFIVLTNTTFITIDSGNKGVLFKKFGGGLDKETIYDQGFHVVAPWNTLIVYDVRVGEGFETMDVLSKNGLSISVEMSYRYLPIADKIGYIHDEVGRNYIDKILIPEIRSATREVIGEYFPEELYSTKREDIQDEIFKRTQEAIDSKHIEIDAVLIRSVQLPDKLKAAIELKLEEEQSALQYEYRLNKERKEAERKIIEANANAEANRILSASLTDKILQDKGIEATLTLANSQNAKVVIVGGGENGLPMILGN